MARLISSGRRVLAVGPGGGEGDPDARLRDGGLGACAVVVEPGADVQEAMRLRRERGFPVVAFGVAEKAREGEAPDLSLSPADLEPPRLEPALSRIAAAFPKLSVVVVTYGRADLTRLCLSSLVARTEWPNLEIIVVDNASPDDTLEVLAELEQSRLAFPDHPQRGEPRIRGRDERRVRRREGRIPRGPQQRHRAHARLADGARAAPPIPRTARPRRAGDERGRQRGADRGRLRRSRRPAPLGGGLDSRARRRDLRHPDARVLLPGDASPDVRGGRPARRALRRRDVRGRRLQPARARRGTRGALRAGRLRPPLEDGVVPPAGQGRVLRALRGEPQASRRSGVLSPTRPGVPRPRRRGSRPPPGAAARGARADREEERRGDLPPVRRLGDPPLPAPAPSRARLRASRWVAIFDSSNAPYDRVDGFKEIEPDLFLFSGRRSCFTTSVPGTVGVPVQLSSRRRLPDGHAGALRLDRRPRRVPAGPRAPRSNHERALSEATVVASVARKLHVVAQARRPDAVYLPNGVESGASRRPPRRLATRISRTSSRRARRSSATTARSPSGSTIRSSTRCRTPPRLAVRADRPAVRREPSGTAAPRAAQRALARSARLRHASGLPLLFDVATIPFRINPITLATSPLKLFEYFAGASRSSRRRCRSARRFRRS